MRRAGFEARCARTSTDGARPPRPTVLRLGASTGGVGRRYGCRRGDRPGPAAVRAPARHGEPAGRGDRADARARPRGQRGDVPRRGDAGRDRRAAGRHRVRARRLGDRARQRQGRRQGRGRGRRARAVPGQPEAADRERGGVLRRSSGSRCQHRGRGVLARDRMPTHSRAARPGPAAPVARAARHRDHAPGRRVHVARRARLGAPAPVRRHLELRRPRRGPASATQPARTARSPSARSGSATSACCSPGARDGRGARVREHLPAPRARAAPGRRHRRPGQHHLPVPRLVLRPRRRRSRDAAPGRARSIPASGWSSCRYGAGTAGCSSTPRRRSASPDVAVVRRPPRCAGRDRRAVRARAPGPTGPAHVRGGRELEGDHRELPRVLPLPADPPRAVPGQPAGLGRELRPARRVGRWLHVAARRHGDDVDHR